MNEVYSETSTDTSAQPDAQGASDDIFTTANRLYQIDKKHWGPIYRKAKEDLDFLSDQPEAQWQQKDYADRFKTGRPALTMDILTQFVHQVANNIRMNPVSINPIPSGGAATVETATILKGLIKGIEYDSKAENLYNGAATSAIKCSIGYLTIDHDYVDQDENFQQKLLIKPVINPLLVFPDSKFVETDGSDMCHCTILERMTVDDFKAEYPGFDPKSFDSDSDAKWNDDGGVVVAHFFIKNVETRQLSVKNKLNTDVTRQLTKTTIGRYVLNGTNVMKESTFPGQFIPVVPFLGEEAWNDGERNLHSLIRKSKEAQMMRNLMKSVEAEILLKQPIAPVMGPAGAVENYADDWKNPSKAMFLRYDQFDSEGRPINKPERIVPPQPPVGIINSEDRSSDDVKATLGLYNNALGQQGQEVSGVAINARKIQGDVATYHFGDNTVQSVCQVGRILVGAAPVIYDMPQIAMIMNEEDEPEQVGINGMTVQGQAQTYDITKGKYNVRIITGKSFATKRQESANFYQQIITQSPEMMNICGDLLFKNVDVDGAQQLADRMKKVIPPQLLAGEDGAPQQDPQVAALTQKLQQAGQEIQQLQQQVKDKNMGHILKNQTENKKLDMQAQNDKFEQLIQVMELALKKKSVDIDEGKAVGDLHLKNKSSDLETLLGMMKHIQSQSQPQQQPQEIPGQQAGNTAANNGAVNNGVPS